MKKQTGKITPGNRPNRPNILDTALEEIMLDIDIATAEAYIPTREEYEQEMAYDLLTAEAETLEFNRWVRDMEEAFGDIDCPF